MAALITGLGYIGTALAYRLLERGQTVVGLENGFSTVPEVVARLGAHPRVRLARGSVNSARAVERAFSAAAADGGVEVVYHLAAQASAHPEAASVAYTERTNLVAPRLVFEAAVGHRVRRFVYGSSFWVYGDDDLAGRVDEARPYGRPKDLAHLGKVYAEKLLELLAWQGGVTAANVRLGIVYGLGPLMKRDPRFLTVPNLFCLRAVAGEPLVIHPTATRLMGFLHLDDAVDALILAAGAPIARGACAYNAVSEALTVGEVAERVRASAARRGLEARVEGGAPAPTERWSVGSALEPLGFRPRRTMDESLDDVLAYYTQGALG